MKAFTGGLDGQHIAQWLCGGTMGTYQRMVSNASKGGTPLMKSMSCKKG